MTYWYILRKDGKQYKTTEELEVVIAQRFKGYDFELFVNHSADVSSIKLLSSKFTKEDRDKYKVLLRLMK